MTRPAVKSQLGITATSPYAHTDPKLGQFMFGGLTVNWASCFAGYGAISTANNRTIVYIYFKVDAPAYLE